MTINGGYLGGYNSTTGNVNSTTVANNNTVNQSNINSPATTYQQISPLPKVTSCKPVDMAGGAEVYENTDLVLGGNAPIGLSFSRFYNSSKNLEKRTLGYGWTHNYDIYLERHSDGNPGLGRRQPVDAATTIAGLYAMFDLAKTQDNIVGWMTASLSSKWAVDRLIYNQAANVDNAVTVHMGNKVMEFIKLPDGTYAAPPGITTQLIKNGDNTYSLKERFGTQMDFNSGDKISQLKDADGNPMTFIYNPTSGLLTTVTDYFNRTLTLTYSNGKLTSVADSAGRSILYGYTNDDLTSYTDPESKVWGYGYNDLNHPHRMTSLTNPVTVTIATLAYDSLGRVKTQTFPRQGGDTATHNFYFSGSRNTEEDPDGNKLVYYFDEKGRLIAEKNQLIVNENEYTGKKEYDGQNHIAKVTDGRNYSTNFEYDGDQNLIRATNALTQPTDFIYDAQFRLTDTVDPLFHGSHIEYDSEHHPTLSKYGIQYDGNLLPLDNGLSQTSAAYYANGFPQTTTDGRTIVTTRTYDSYGNLDTTKVGSHPVVRTAHDLNLNYQKRGLLTSLTDQVNTTTNFPLYNNRGQLRKKTDPLLKDTIYEYDNAGRLFRITDRNSNAITYSFTPTDKIDTITYQDASTVHFTYDNNDSLITMQDSVGTTGYGYDAVGRITSYTFTYTYNPASFTVAYSQYDANGNLTELTYPGNKKVIYTYDELNRIKTVKIDWLNQTATYNYDDAGRLSSLINFNGTVTTYGYDNANRLTSLENKKSDTTTLASYNFTLDGNGNRTQIVQNEPLLFVPGSDTVSYSYNAKKNRLLTAGGFSFGYDNEGQLSTGYSLNYTFDYEHRLKTIGSTITISYDGKGTRVQAVRSGATTRYIYDVKGNLLAEADGNNSITKYYIYGAGLLAMVTPTNQTYCYHFNAVGSTVAMTDSSQAMVNKYSYDPFGNIVNQQESVQQPFKFVGQHGVMTESNGMYYMRARYYDPEVGRFISEDPIGFQGGDTNLMAYVGNNPVLLIDPSGLINWWKVMGGSLETISGISLIGGTASAAGATAGLATPTAVSGAITGAALVSHGVTNVIAGFADSDKNIPSAAPLPLATLAVTGSTKAASIVDTAFSLSSGLNAAINVNALNSWQTIEQSSNLLGTMTDMTYDFTRNSSKNSCGGR
jgi:RHS repeat-associated protein